MWRLSKHDACRENAASKHMPQSSALLSENGRFSPLYRQEGSPDFGAHGDSPGSSSHPGCPLSSLAASSVGSAYCLSSSEGVGQLGAAAWGGEAQEVWVEGPLCDPGQGLSLGCNFPRLLGKGAGAQPSVL